MMIHTTRKPIGEYREAAKMPKLYKRSAISDLPIREPGNLISETGSSIIPSIT